ncbi:alpha-N-acetylgalactosaminidase-like isoform X2 [Rhodnius prolixus]|uniref:alpha-N-acetylgalactosaminidase-like isoform X2 n=1 Tax=Rhodnius prolixus TaxID=13249 RepID=UPI003D188967
MRFIASVLLIISLIDGNLALDNGLALTPPMGWMTWERFRCTIDCTKYPNECISDALVRRTADLMVEKGYLQAGYQYLIIDDCWLEYRRSEEGNLVADRTRFPYGMPKLIEYVHSKGLKFGIYENYGNKTCEGYPGLIGHEKVDVTMFAEWGIDYIKVDGCYYDGYNYAKGYEALGQYLNQTGRPIVYSCSYPAYHDASSIPTNYQVLSENCNLWRNYDDIQDSWGSVTDIMDYYALKQDYIAQYAGPGHWNDPDMLIIGNFGLSYDQSKVQMAIWTILAAPLLLSTDLATIRSEFQEILLNKNIIEVHQDPLGIQGLRVYRKDKVEVWTRKVTPYQNQDYSYAVAICSRRDDGFPYPFTLDLKRISLLHTKGYTIKDLYTNENLPGVFYPDSQLTVRINPSGVVFLKATIVQ